MRFCFFWLSQAFPAFALLNQNDPPGQGNSFWLSETKAVKATESRKTQNTPFFEKRWFLKGTSLITGNGGRIQLLEVDPMGGVNF